MSGWNENEMKRNASVSANPNPSLINVALSEFSLWLGVVCVCFAVPLNINIVPQLVML